LENSVRVANPLSRLFTFIKPYWSRLSIGIGYSFFNKLLDLAPPVLVGWAVDTVTKNPHIFSNGFLVEIFTLVLLCWGFWGY
jgi:ABC-type multidrug transport system fused ATPase/permease subunit